MTRNDKDLIVCAAERCERVLEKEAECWYGRDFEGAARCADWARAESWLAFTIAGGARNALGWYAP